MFNRARPWRSRGPSLGSPAGSRRRGHCSRENTGLTANVQSDATFEVTFAEDFVVSGGATFTVPLAATPVPVPVPVARIDEAGLRAMAGRAREQDQGWLADDIGLARIENPIVNPPLDLFVASTSEPMAVPRPRRSA